jgi:hypothetical protein
MPPSDSGIQPNARSPGDPSLAEPTATIEGRFLLQRTKRKGLSWNPVCREKLRRCDAVLTGCNDSSVAKT